LPKDMIALENDLAVSFVKRDSSLAMNSIPVAWMWRGSKEEVINACCIKDNTPKPRSIITVAACCKRQKEKELSLHTTHGNIVSIAGCCAKDGPMN
jgi:hypothetical protein